MRVPRKYSLIYLLSSLACVYLILKKNITQIRYCDLGTGQALRPGVTCCNSSSECSILEKQAPRSSTLNSLIRTLSVAFPAPGFTSLLDSIKVTTNATFIADAFFSFALNSGVGGLQTIANGLLSSAILNSSLVSKVNSNDQNLPESIRSTIDAYIASANATSG
jgi:hypothetical protein